MPNSLSSPADIRSEVYRRTMQARRNGTKSWRECIDSATNMVMIEMDYWIMVPGSVL